MTKKEEFRKDLTTRLNDDRYWVKWADGYISCPICGCLAHPGTKLIHIIWHEVNNQ